MGESQPTVEWECDRCGKRETLPNDQQPMGWCRFYFATPPRAGDKTPCAVLCNECGGDAVEFLHGGQIESLRLLEQVANSDWLPDHWKAVLRPYATFEFSITNNAE